MSIVDFFLKMMDGRILLEDFSDNKCNGNGFLNIMLTCYAVTVSVWCVLQLDSLTYIGMLEKGTFLCRF